MYLVFWHKPTTLAIGLFITSAIIVLLLRLWKRCLIFIRIIENLFNDQLPTEDEVRQMCYAARDILIEEGNIQAIPAPVTVCGDIHGQFADLKELFKVGGYPPNTRYLFLGDFVDRGHNSIETLLLLVAYKLRYASHITLVRGNHESRQITQIYGFYDECMRKYGSPTVWKLCCDLFDYMSLGALVQDSYLNVHGGLSPSISSLDQIRMLNRRQEVPHEGAMCDLLWSDPEDSITEWMLSPRGAGYLFGEDVAMKFFHENSLDGMARAHQLVMEGYKTQFNETVTTIWSAPNYCYRCGNVAAIMEISGDMNRSFKIFSAAPEDPRNPPVRKPSLEYFL